MNGWIILDKPSGITSAHAVAKVKRLLKPKKIGHAGTLDPLASGVLPLALGEATKVIHFMVDAGKAYGFTTTWGEERDTDDSEGKTTQTSPQRPSRDEIEAILPRFTGTILQTPPAYSAIKVDGARSYDLARAGEAVELKARQVRVDSLEIEGHSPEKTSFNCECGKGTYIRSLARDMGRELGCLGYVTVLRRLKVGKFDVNHAISLENLEKMVHKDDLGFLYPVESALDDIPAVEIDSDQAKRIKQGQVIPFASRATERTVLAKHNDILVAVCSVAQDMMTPVRVFNL
jgi:tRNA pseudouridine55 synthase